MLSCVGVCAKVVKGGSGVKEGIYIRRVTLMLTRVLSCISVCHSDTYSQP